MPVRSAQCGLVEAFLHPSVGRNDRLALIDEQIDWRAIDAALGAVKPGHRGPPSYPSLLMFKALLLQQWYNLSDPGLEEALCDRMSFRRFVGLGGDQAAPDHATLWRFRQALTKAGADQAAFAAITAQLDAQGLIMRQGTMIDASLIAAQSKPPAKPKDPEPGANCLVKLEREPDADWTRRGGRLFFGYKTHIAMDKGSQLIRHLLMTAASINDTVPADDLIMGDEKELWADKAYDSHARRALLKERGIKNRISRRPNKHHALGPWAQKRNHGIARIRGRVETIFAIMKRHYHHGRARYLTLARNQTDLTLAAIAINLRRSLVLTS